MFISNKIRQKSNIYFGWYVLIGAGLVQLVSNASGSLGLSMFIVPMKNELNFSMTLFSGAISSGSILAAISAIPIGFLFDLKKTRYVLIFSIILMGIATYAMSYVNGWISLYILVAITRMLFSTPMMIGGSVITAKWFVVERGKANGILYAFHSAGMIIFPVLASIFIINFGWRQAWEYLGIIVVLVALVPAILFIYEEPESLGIKFSAKPKDDEGNNNFSVQDALKTKSLWIISIGTGILYFFHSGINTHQAAFLQDRGISLGLSSLVISVNAISTGIGSIVWGLICDRVNIKYAFSSVFICSMLAIISLIFTYNIFLAILASVFFGFAMGGMLTVPSVAYANFFGVNSLGKIRGITHPFSTAGAAIGVMVSGIIFDIYGSYSLAFWIYFIISIVMFVFSLFLSKPISTKSQF